jgi:Uma2 family endonuclease
MGFVAIRSWPSPAILAVVRWTKSAFAKSLDFAPAQFVICRVSLAHLVISIACSIINHMAVGTIKMTARQFLELGEDPPGARLELVNGEVAVSPSAIPDHSFVVTTLVSILVPYISKHDLGQLFLDVDTIFGEYDVRRPDILYFQKSRLNLIGEKAMQGPPDLAVEVLSPSSIATDRKDKFKLYAAGKVKYYWIVDPKLRRIEAYRLSGGKFVGRVRGSRSDVVQLPPFVDLKIPLNKLWRPKN